MLVGSLPAASASPASNPAGNPPLRPCSRPAASRVRPLSWPEGSMAMLAPPPAAATALAKAVRLAILLDEEVARRPVATVGWQEAGDLEGAGGPPLRLLTLVVPAARSWRVSREVVRAAPCDREGPEPWGWRRQRQSHVMGAWTALTLRSKTLEKRRRDFPSLNGLT